MLLLEHGHAALSSFKNGGVLCLGVNPQRNLQLTMCFILLVYVLLFDFLTFLCIFPDGQIVL